MTLLRQPNVRKEFRSRKYLAPQIGRSSSGLSGDRVILTQRKKRLVFTVYIKKGASAVKMISRHGQRVVRHAPPKSLSSCRLTPLVLASFPLKGLHEGADKRYEGTRKTQPGTR